MLWRVALAVVCVGGVCSSVRADVMSRMMVPRDYGVKLCGREFIRAVIFTCGGSRWKRSTEGDADPFQWTSLSDLPAEDDRQSWQLDAERSPLPVPSSSLSDLLTLYRTSGDRQRSPSRVSDTPGGSVVLGEQEDAADWFVSSRKKRNFSLGVAGMCCSQGCTKNDIGRLC
ncbi:prorelaxin H1 [Austrofundulus limnaeus]|uniref:Prorelaxin H1 n=1 Tax=Austrofundulus limnaeus TaxID=52670 RepID=A0A2I4AUZ2_AUSLI|nr:PREDICTED: relaxin-3-like [Austrofundulus limnaeus]